MRKIAKWWVALAMGLAVAVAAPADDLIRAATYGDTVAVQALLDKGTDVNARTNDGLTALILASADNHREAVRVLLEKGADVNATNNDGDTALMVAAQGDYREVVQALLDKGADVNATDNAGRTALIQASQGGYREIVQALLDKGADVNARRYSDGSTALIMASLNGHPEVVQALLDKGADAHGKNSCGAMLTSAGILLSVEGSLFSVKINDEIRTMYADKKTLFFKDEKKVSSLAEFEDMIGTVLSFYHSPCLADNDAAGHLYVFIG